MRFNIQVQKSYSTANRWDVPLGLFGEDDAYCRAILVRFGFDTHDVASQAQGAVLGSADSGVVELDLQFGLQLGAVIEINQRAVQAQIPDDRFLFKGHARIGEAGDHGAEMRVAAQAFANGGNDHIQADAA